MTFQASVIELKAIATESSRGVSSRRASRTSCVSSHDNRSGALCLHLDQNDVKFNLEKSYAQLSKSAGGA